MSDLRLSRFPRPPGPPSDGRFLSREQCTALAKRVASFAVGGGHVQTIIESTWTGHVRWARNRILSGGDVRDTPIQIEREIHGAQSRIGLNSLEDAALDHAVRVVERMLQRQPETVASAFEVEYTEQYLTPTIWSEATYTLAAEARAELARTLIAQAEAKGMVAAGSIEVTATGRGVLNTRGRALYYPFTDAQYSVTVRDPKGVGSGWAGGSHYDWAKIDAPAITERALEKCLASRNPVALEPGRYTTILEPQAVSDILSRNTSAPIRAF